MEGRKRVVRGLANVPPRILRSIVNAGKRKECVITYDGDLSALEPSQPSYFIDSPIRETHPLTSARASLPSDIAYTFSRSRQLSLHLMNDATRRKKNKSKDRVICKIFVKAFQRSCFGKEISPFIFSQLFGLDIAVDIVEE